MLPLYKVGSFKTSDKRLADRLQIVYDCYEVVWNRGGDWETYSRIFWDVAEAQRPILEVIETW